MISFLIEIFVNSGTGLTPTFRMWLSNMRMFAKHRSMAAFSQAIQSVPDDFKAYNEKIRILINKIGQNCLSGKSWFSRVICEVRRENSLAKKSIESTYHVSLVRYHKGRLGRREKSGKLLERNQLFSDRNFGQISQSANTQFWHDVIFVRFDRLGAYIQLAGDRLDSFPLG